MRSLTHFTPLGYHFFFPKFYQVFISLDATTKPDKLLFCPEREKTKSTLLVVQAHKP